MSDISKSDVWLLVKGVFLVYFLWSLANDLGDVFNIGMAAQMLSNQAQQTNLAFGKNLILSYKGVLDTRQNYMLLMALLDGAFAVWIATSMYKQNKPKKKPRSLIAQLEKREPPRFS